MRLTANLFAGGKLIVELKMDTKQSLKRRLEIFPQISFFSLALLCRLNLTTLSFEVALSNSLH